MQLKIVLRIRVQLIWTRLMRNKQEEFLIELLVIHFRQYYGTKLKKV